MTPTEEALRRARRRALRAAQVVTISLAIATGGCGDDATGTDGGATADSGSRDDGGSSDAGGGRDSGGSDAGGADSGGLADAGLADAGRADAGGPDAGTPGFDAGPAGCVPRPFEDPCKPYDCVCVPTDPGDPDCCTDFGGFAICSPDGTVGCAVPGPFVPPAMIA
jgi:hypothetical protein